MKGWRESTSVFWRCGLAAIALVLLSTLVVRVFGLQSPIALILLPVFFVLFQVPYLVVAYLTEGRGVFRGLFYGPPWLAIPCWGLLIFLWNGCLAALFACGYDRWTKRV
jgi:hypothetical protein